MFGLGFAAAAMGVAAAEMVKAGDWVEAFFMLALAFVLLACALA
jgi:hypothetical protein